MTPSEIEPLSAMAPVATRTDVQPSKQEVAQLINPFYSPAIGDDGDSAYPFADLKVSKSLDTQHQWPT